VANGFEDQIKDQGPLNVGGESSSNFLGAGKTNSGKKGFTYYTMIYL
jgi:hypothetical protein